MSSEELTELMKQIDQTGIGWDVVEKKLKVPHDLLRLYARSGPVPVTILNGLQALLEESKKESS